MPFTFSHPAIVLPLTYFSKKWVSVTGLVIGSLTPDFEYFLRMRIKSNYSHTFYGLFWFDLQLGVLLTFIFHNIVRNSLFNNSPTFLKVRVSKFVEFDWNGHFRRNWILILTSILIGAASHILWDSFTHEHGYFVQSIPILKNTVDLFGRKISIFKILQHSSTIMGGVVIAIAIYKLPINKIKKESVKLKYWITLTLFSLIILSIIFLSGLEIVQYGSIIVTSISAILISLILTSVVMKLKKNDYNL